jgi:hypothetical protein
MEILTLTTTEAVRAVLGISEESSELPDQLFTDLDMPNLLLLELSGWLPASITQIEDAAFASDDETARANLAYLALKAASAYYCASVALESGELSFAERYEDGQNKLKRQTHDVQALLDRIYGKYLYHRQQVLTYTETPAETYSSSWMVGRSVPSYDPVTNSTS